MKTIIINAGSSSLRVSIFSKNKEIATYTISQIGEEGSQINSEHIREKNKAESIILDHSDAFAIILELLFSQGIINSIGEVVGIAHRVVHGGTYFSDSVIIDDDVIDKIEKCIEIAPLHNPINLECIMTAMKTFSEIPHIAIFDTAFHQTIPEVNYIYALPKKYSEKYNIRKYGFHGSSHKYMSERVLKVSKRKLRRLITCHVGGGASICAIHDGKSINTSMGFTPVDGLVMGTRSGDIDPETILYIGEKECLSPSEMSDILNKESGMLGLTGVTGDIKDVQEAIKLGHVEYKMALDVYISRIVRYIGSYIADLGGLDAIVFTGGVLENDAMIRTSIAKKLHCFGLIFDESQNDFRSEERLISTKDSKVELYVIPMQEETMMQKELKEFL